MKIIGGVIGIVMICMIAGCIGMSDKAEEITRQRDQKNHPEKYTWFTPDGKKVE